METVIEGMKISYEIAGEGEMVLLLHGWGGCLQSFLPIASVLSGSFRTLLVDLPGFGGSDAPQKPWSVSEYAQITAKLLEKLGVRKCHIIAHSFGGRVAILLASGWPELAGKMVLTGCAGMVPKHSMRYYFKVYKYKLAKKAVKHKALCTLCKIVGLDAKKTVKNAGSEDYKKLDDNMKKTFVRIVNQDLRPELKKIRSPVLLIWGDQDTETPLYMARIMEKEIPDAGLVVLSGAGHFAYIERIVDFNRIVSYFLKGN
ncbi:MAG: alpha/beta hydrolase [Bacillota bacterium]|nr:alpha/beta hydrolase [Bacillota bacterium]